MILSTDSLDKLIRDVRWFLLAGLAAVFTQWFVGKGVVCAAALFFLAVSLVSVRSYRTESGLWMLAGLIVCLVLSTMPFLVWGAISDLKRGVSIFSSMQMTAVIYLQWLTIRSMASVIFHNRRLTNRCN